MGPYCKHSKKPLSSLQLMIAPCKTMQLRGAVVSSLVQRPVPSILLLQYTEKSPEADASLKESKRKGDINDIKQEVTAEFIYMNS